MSENTVSTFRILVATDNHLGFKCRDCIRQSDSFDVFEEILKLATVLQVDFILHAGDLFDHHKPERSILYKTMCLLRAYCLGTKSSPTFHMLNQNTRSSILKLIKANYEQNTTRVTIPFIGIHGNHDDPGGDAFLSSLDLLEASSLMTYFGWIQNVDDIHIHPMLLEKGSTKIALYGLGNIRDERLNRAFKAGKVHFHKPETGNVKDFFNLLVIHQNRFKGTFDGAPNTDCIPEHLLPSFLDLVIWGHEHDATISAVEHLQVGFHVIQPGSSIATSLTHGEALPKHVACIEIRKDSFRSTFIPLRNVRPLLLTDIALYEKNLPTATEKDVFEYLTSEVESQLETIEEKWEDHLRWHQNALEETIFPSLNVCKNELHELFEWFDKQLPLGLQSSKKSTPLPLIRLRIDYTGFETVNVQRFGLQFVNRVANPEDLLLFKKKKKTPPTYDKNSTLPILEIADFDTGNGHTLQDLIFTLFDKSSGELEILPEPDLNIAIQHYVHKTEATAIEQFIHTTLRRNQNELKVLDTTLTREEIRQHVYHNTKNARQSHQPLQLTQQEKEVRDTSCYEDHLMDLLLPSQQVNDTITTPPLTLDKQSSLEPYLQSDSNGTKLATVNNMFLLTAPSTSQKRTLGREKKKGVCTKKIKKETGAATVIKRKMELQKKLEKLPSHFLSKETNEITQQTCEATFSVDGSVECKQLTNSKIKAIHTSHSVQKSENLSDEDNIDMLLDSLDLFTC